MKPGDFEGLRVFLSVRQQKVAPVTTTLKRINLMTENKLCSFCISKKTCKKPEPAKENNCKDYMLKTDREYDHK